MALKNELDVLTPNIRRWSGVSRARGGKTSHADQRLEKVFESLRFHYYFKH
jgi:hypothetical protein